MEIKYYLRIENNSFVFLLKDLHQIKKTDIEVTDGEHEEFMNLQSQGKQFRLKETPAGNGLFDYLEEYTPEVIEEIIEPGVDEFMLETDFRLSKLELGV